MDDEEKVETQPKKDILDELNDRMINADTKGAGFSKYTQDTQRYTQLPEDQFAHAWKLVDIKKGDPKQFDDLLNPHVFLGSVDDPKSLRYYQNDIFWLNNMFRLAKDDEMMDYVFAPLWNSFLAELRVTSCLDGSERIFQAFQIPRSGKRKGFKFWEKSKKKKEPIDYIVPDEDASMY